MKSIIIFSLFLLSFVNSQAQINNAQTETVKIYGNCGMCETAIEKAANKKDISKADWNEETKMATITFDKSKTNLNAVLKNIALAGYDSDKFLAPELAYNKLSGCCKYDRPNSETSNEIINTNTNEKNVEQNQTVTQQTSHLQSIFDNYFALKDALVKSDAAISGTKAHDLGASLSSVKMETLTSQEHTAWMQVEKELKSETDNISAAKELALQRDQFSRLSKNMYTLLKTSKLSDKVYYQYCPMYKDAKGGKGGNWLSKDIAIKNPYYGSMMMTCGKTVETIQ